MKTTLQKVLEDSDLYYWALSKRFIQGHPFTIVPPLKPIYRDPEQEVYIEKAAQVFISEYLINLALFTADTLRADRGNCLYIFPATPQISDFSMARIEPVIYGSKYLMRRRNYARDMEGGATVKNVALKRIGNGLVYLRGSNRRTQLISVDADTVIYDELDEMADGTVPAGKARTGSSKSPIFRGASTPKYPRLGIDQMLSQSDDKKWLVKCTRCNHEVDLAKALDVVFPIPSKASFLQVDSASEEVGTHFHIGRNYYVGCPQCKHILNVWNGRWVASRTIGVSFGGYHVPKLISNLLDFNLFAKRVEDYREERLLEKATQEFFNSDLGLPRAPQGAQLAVSDFIQCSTDVPDKYVFHIGHSESLFRNENKYASTYMGVDVSPQVLHIGIIGFNTHNEELREINPDTTNLRPILLYAGRIRTDIKGNGFPELDPYLQRYNVTRCVIDSRPEGMHARQFCARNAGRAFTAEYIAWKNKGNLIYKFDLEKRNVQMGRTETLDVVFNYILKRQFLLPTNILHVGGNLNAAGLGEFVSNFLNLTKITDEEKAEAVYVDGGSPDHYAHAINYAFTAARISELNGDEIGPVSSTIPIGSTKVGDYNSVYSAISFGITRRPGNSKKGGSNVQKGGSRRSRIFTPGTSGYY